MDIYELIFIRYRKPIVTLLDGWVWKTIVAFLLTIWEMTMDMFATEGELVLLLCLALTADFVTGIFASRRNEVIINSLGFRQTIVKATEYFLILLLVAALSNTFAGDVPAIENLTTWAYLFAIVTEFKSIVENVSKGRESKVKDIWKYVLKKLTNKTDIDE